MLSSALEEENTRLCAGVTTKAAAPAPDLSADTCFYLQDGSRVRTHSLVLAAGSAYFRHLAQVHFITPCTDKKENQIFLTYKVEQLHSHK
jgi:hypothetical protein